MQDVGRNYRNRLIQEKMLAFSLSIFEHKKLGSRILGFRIRMVLKIHATKTKKKRSSIKPSITPISYFLVLDLKIISLFLQPI